MTLARLIAVRERIAQIDPDGKLPSKLSSWIELLTRTPEAKHVAILGAISVVEPALAHVIDGRCLDALPVETFPGLAIGQLARLVLGESLAQISGLDRRDAHVWATTTSNAPPSLWLLQRAGIAADVRDIRIARWLVSVWHDPQRRECLSRERTERGPHGETVTGSYLQRVDELRPADLRPSVEATFTRAAKRMQRDLERSLQSKGESLHVVPRWWREVRCARLLRTGPDLVAEGRALGHCVGQYAGYVKRGESVIVGLTVLGHRSTVEIDPSTREVRQHRGPRNEAPHELNVRALKVCLRRWATGGYYRSSPYTLKEIAEHQRSVGILPRANLIGGAE